MIFKRAVAKLRAQDWAAITIELGIVVLGVFMCGWSSPTRSTANPEVVRRQAGPQRADFESPRHVPDRHPAATLVAAKLRAHPELVAELAQHDGAVAAQLTNPGLFEAQVDVLVKGIDRLR